MTSNRRSFIEQQILDMFAFRHSPETTRRDMVRAQFAAHVSPKQLAFLEDTSKDTAACTGRQAGKTTAIAYKLLETALVYPESLSGYSALTRKNAKLLMWPELQKLNAKHKLGFTFHNSDLVATDPDGSRVWLTGADNEASVEKFRGFRFKYIALDEAQAYGPYLKNLVVDVLDPALIAHNGSKSMTGTPGPVLDGFFYDACTDKELGWSTHHFTVLDNPYIHDAAGWLAERRKKTNMPQSTYDREWMGLWVPDLNALVYHYSEDVNRWLQLLLPASPVPWEYGLGVDIGYDPDPMGFVIAAWNRHNLDMHFLYSKKFSEMLPSQAAAHIKKLDEKYRFSKIVGDGAGLGKGIIEEWRQHYGIAITPARDKHLKREHIQLMNDDFRTGRIKVWSGIDLEHELKQVLWDDDHKKISDRYPNDLTDAAEYIYLECKHFAAKPIEPPPVVGTAMWAQREAERYERRAVEKAKARARQSIR